MDHFLPVHLKKIVKDYTAGKITSKDVTLEVSKHGIVEDAYVFVLPTYDVLGEPTGTHTFSLTIESLVATKTRVLAALNEHAAQVDEFVKQYDLLIAVLQDVKNKKK
jgi:hypothetical protein